jgi:hypothetical protein
MHELERQLEVWTRREYACLFVAFALFGVQMWLEMDWLGWPRLVAWLAAAAACYQRARILRRAQLDGASLVMRALVLVVIGLTSPL